MRVGTGAGCRHLPAFPAIKGVVKPENSYSQFITEFLTEILGFVGAVIPAGTRMVPADNHMGTPVIPPHQGMKDRLPRPGVTHGRREDP